MPTGDSRQLQARSRHFPQEGFKHFTAVLAVIKCRLNGHFAARGC